MSTFKMPDLGEGLQQAEIIAWHVAEGDDVVADQPLLSVETEKAVVEIPSPLTGRIRRLLAQSGAHVPVGAPLLDFEDGSVLDPGTVIGQPQSATAADRHSTPQASVETRGLRAAPAVRARARELGVDLACVSPTGIDGSITQADVLAAASAAAEPDPPEQDLLHGARRTMALNMARAWREVVHAGLHDWADVAAWGADADVTLRLIRAIIAGCAAEPSLNARFDASKLSLHRNPRIDIGIATHSPDGLFVPVLRDAARSGPDEWRRQISHFKQGVKDRSLAPAELRDPSITLSNFGTIAGQHGMLIVVPPQVATLGSGRITDRAVREGEKLALHRMLPLSLMFDHRAISGGEAARFLHAVIGDLEFAS
jgi:2-oxoisovalerate dehydrogenase E2 component (dihydrolipoyl transacylase)